jgi:hypothetical protein
MLSTWIFAQTWYQKWAFYLSAIFLIEFDRDVGTGGGKSFDGGMSHDHSPQETDECSLLVTFIQDRRGTAWCQNRLQTMDMGE